MRSCVLKSCSRTTILWPASPPCALMLPTTALSCASMSPPLTPLIPKALATEVMSFSVANPMSTGPDFGIGTAEPVDTTAPEAPGIDPDGCEPVVEPAKAVPVVAGPPPEATAPGADNPAAGPVPVADPSPLSAVVAPVCCTVVPHAATDSARHSAPTHANG